MSGGVPSLTSARTTILTRRLLLSTPPLRSALAPSYSPEASGRPMARSKPGPSSSWHLRAQDRLMSSTSRNGLARRMRGPWSSCRLGGHERRLEAIRQTLGPSILAALFMLACALSSCDAGGLLIVEDLDGGAEVDAGEDAEARP